MPIPSTIVIRSLSLLRALSAEYGSTKAMEIWEKMSEIIDDGDLRMEVFKVMLTGGYAGTHIELRKWEGDGKVTAIKELRKWTHTGLKEAKDAVEVAATNTRTSHQLRKQWDAEGDEMALPYEKIMEDLAKVGLTVELV